MNSVLKKYPKLATFFLFFISSSIACLIFLFVINLNIFQDAKDGEKYSLVDKISYAVRCNDKRNIRLREWAPNREYNKYPSAKFDTLEHKKYILRSDNDGMIKPSFTHQDPDLQIFFLGGSTTECEFVDEEFRFPYLSGRKLEEKLKIKINSDSAARSGNNSLHSINILINKLLPYNPDIVVMMHNVNDLTSLFYEGTYWNKNKIIAPIDCAEKKSKVLKHNDEWSNSEWSKKVINDPKEQDHLVRQFEENLQLFINICRAKNITPVLLTQPNRIVKDNYFATGRGKEVDEVYKNLYQRFSLSIKKIGAKNNVLVIDLENKVPSDKKYIYDQVHVNKEGSILEATVIAEELEKYLRKTKLITNLNN